MRLVTAIVLTTVLGCLCGQAIVPPKGAQGSQANTSATKARKVMLLADDVEALRSDVQRMKNVVQQMENNLAFVDTMQSPLKHQFQLEIEMWKTVIAEMERKLDAATTH